MSVILNCSDGIVLAKKLSKKSRYNMFDANSQLEESNTDLNESIKSLSTVSDIKGHCKYLASALTSSYKLTREQLDNLFRLVESKVDEIPESKCNFGNISYINKITQITVNSFVDSILFSK